jgi:7,8-dihydro-6-hydroxymethylpterin-pyrophosphokinase
MAVAVGGGGGGEPANRGRLAAIASVDWLRTTSAMPHSRAEFSNAAAFAGVAALAATELLAKAVADEQQPGRSIS